jgi:hemerythrin
MVLIEWRDEFKVGVPVIDREHQELIALINKAHAHMAEPDSDVTISDFLGEIYAHIATHFDDEEQLMRAARYDQFEEHADEHARLLDEMRDMMRDYEHRHQYKEDELFARLRDWFINHFKTHDARLHGRLGH